MTKPKQLVSLPGGWPEDSPPRSAFFGLAPEGYNGESFEGLASYFRRLSAHHGILPRSLAVRAIVPLFATCTSKNENWLAASCYDLNIDGVAGVTADWVGALERLTLRSDLHLRTLLPLQNLVSSFSLISTRERFCPLCYEADERAARPMYNRLLWSIACVDACPLHSSLLQDSPSAPKMEMRAFSVPGISRLDGCSLSTVPPQHANEQQTQCARLVAELLDDVHHHSHVFVDSRSSGAFLRYAADKLFNGKAAHLARHFGVAKSELHGWMAGEIRPSLPRLVLIAYCCGCGISDVLLANKVRLRKVQPASNVKCLSKKTRKGSARPRQELQAELERIVAKLGTSTTLREAARSLDVSEKYLRRIAPGIAAILVSKGKQARHAESARRAEFRFQHFRQSFEELTVDDVPPPLYKVRKHVYLKSEIKLGFDEGQRFLRRIRGLTAAGN
jgi:hypothetical protein